DICEAAVLVLAIQTIPVGRFVAIEIRESGQRIPDMACIHKKNVQKAVVIVVQERDASRHGLDQVFSGGRRIAENKINALGGADVEAWAGGRGLGKQAERAEESKRAGFPKSCRRQFESHSQVLWTRLRETRFFAKRSSRGLNFSSREE